MIIISQSCREADLCFLSADTHTTSIGTSLIPMSCFLLFHLLNTVHVIKTLVSLFSPSSAPLSRSPCSSRAASVAPSPSPSLPRHLDTEQDSPSVSSLSSDTDGSCYTELYPGPQSYVERLRAEETPPGLDSPRGDDGGGSVFFSPVVETVSSFRPSGYRSPLMPKENKPLEVGVLRRVKELLAEIDPRTAAKHITKADCMVGCFLN